MIDETLAVFFLIFLEIVEKALLYSIVILFKMHVFIIRIDFHLQFISIERHISSNITAYIKAYEIKLNKAYGILSALLVRIWTYHL